jgi:uncharacterized phage protein gp47/JayE
MPGPYPLATLAATIDQNGIAAPTFGDIFASLQAAYQQIYGSDADLAPDSQDGQWIGVQSQIVYDMNAALIAGYLSYAPTTAQGIGLSSVVKINGMRRLVPSNSSAAVVLVGQAGTTINDGVIADPFNNRWDLPPVVEIPIEGQVTVTAVCETAGATTAAPNTLTTMLTLFPGWQSVTNPAAAFAGNPLETDATLRKRQSVSTSLPAITPLTSIFAAVANVPGVGRTKVYDNDTDFYSIPDAIPPHSIAVVVEGGDADQIAQTIALKKNTGCGTYGSTEVIVQDPAGVPLTIDFFYLIEQPIFVAVTIQPLPGYLDTIGKLIIAAIAQFIENLEIGEDVYAAWLMAPADLAGDAAMQAAGVLANTAVTQAQLDQYSSTYVVRNIAIGLAANPTTANDINVPFNAAASCNPSNITLSLVQ